jgi:predicted nuclease of predicted toxin-antitoxin system
MKLILDEDLPRDLLTAFKQSGHDAVHVEDLGLEGDPERRPPEPHLGHL